jgi:hypothetical protein
LKGVDENTYNSFLQNPRTPNREYLGSYKFRKRPTFKGLFNFVILGNLFSEIILRSHQGQSSGEKYCFYFSVVFFELFQVNVGLFRNVVRIFLHL